MASLSAVLGAGLLWALGVSPIGAVAGGVLLGIVGSWLAARREPRRASRVTPSEPAVAGTESGSFLSFLSFVSHELRAPLNAMTAWLPILSETDDPATARRALDVLERNLALQARLVDDLIDAARITSGKLELERHRCDLVEVVRNVYASELPTAEEQGIALAFEAPSDLAVDGDVERLTQVFTNLVANALKFTEEGGRVAISVAAEGGDAVVAVEDNGRGISPEALPGVFQLYRQESGAPGSGDGLGIGLAIVANLVELHGGSVRAESDGIGRGARFEVRLPAKVRASGTSGDATEPSPETLEGVRVLIVDRNRFAAEALALTLEEAGAQVDWARDATTAAAAAEASRPDLLVNGLVENDGVRLLRALRARHPRLRSITLVDARSGEVRARMKRAGYEASVRRSLPPAEVRGRIVKLLDREPSVLLVDDERDSADSLALLLRRRGYAVTIAYGYDQAVEAGERERIDLVVTDISLPDGAGTELAQRLRLLGARRVIALSGHDPSSVPGSNRFDAYVRKPVELETLLEALAGD